MEVKTINFFTITIVCLSINLSAVQQETMSFNKLLYTLQRCHSQCNEVTQEEIEPVIEFLHNNPKIKQKLTKVKVINEIIIHSFEKKITYNLALRQNIFTYNFNEVTGDYQKVKNAAANAHKNSAYAQNCGVVFEQFQNLLAS